MYHVQPVTSKRSTPSTRDFQAVLQKVLPAFQLETIRDGESDADTCLQTMSYPIRGSEMREFKPPSANTVTVTIVNPACRGTLTARLLNATDTDRGAHLSRDPRAPLIKVW